MKIILSRKGFDSQYGGYPSPILPDGRLLSLPIPNSRDKFQYNSLKIDGFGTYYDVMTQLHPWIQQPSRKKINLRRDTKCHLDPDLRRRVIKRTKGWKPLFGPHYKAHTHLKNQGVCEDDIFLFYGTFQATELINDSLKFIPDESEKHIIFGYLQISKEVDTRDYGWMSYHSHDGPVYVARDNHTWDSRLPGAASFIFDEPLVLTKEGYKKSFWELPNFFKEVDISYHSKKSWINKNGGYFKTKSPGQEYVIEANKKVENWTKKIVMKTNIF